MKFQDVSFRAHRGDCVFCEKKRTVVMWRNSHTLELEPDRCWCILCGALYSANVENIKDWELKQWQEKLKMENDSLLSF